MEGSEDHGLLLPGSVLHHAHHALQTGEAVKAPHALAQGSPLFSTRRGSGVGPGCLGGQRRRPGVLGEPRSRLPASPSLGAQVAFVPAALSRTGGCGGPGCKAVGFGWDDGWAPSRSARAEPRTALTWPRPADRLLLPLGLSVEEQVQEGARGVRDHGEREPPPPGERPASARGRPLHRRQVERGAVVGHSREGGGPGAVLHGGAFSYRLLSLPSLRPHAPRRQCVPLAAGHRPWGQRPGRRQPRFPGPRVPFCEAGPPPAWQAGRARQRQAFVTQIETRAFPPVPCGSVTAKEQACEWGAGS